MLGFWAGAMEDMELNFWKNHNVFVTGATGLLGSWLVEELVHRGANVTCLVRDWVPGSRLVASGNLAKTNFVHGELEDHQLILRVLNEYEIDSVFHLGAQTIVGVSSRSALSTFDANIRGTWNLLEACHNLGKNIQRVVVASSDKAYGEQKNLPYTEDMPLQGRYPYDVSKSCTDLISFSYYYSYGLPVAITRCGNLFGGGDLNFNRLIPGTIHSALFDEAPIIRSDGKYIRDYFYVRDAVNAYLLLAQNLPGESLVGQAFNFGHERPFSVLEMVDLILKQMGKSDLKPRVLNQATNEIFEQYLDCTKAKTLLGWRANYEIESALNETIAWYQEYFQKSPVNLPL
jgi:CDP-glucose 4,6-dehydratase